MTNSPRRCILSKSVAGILVPPDDIAELCKGSTHDSDSCCLGSNPSSAAISLHSQAVKTSPSHGEDWGSIPHGGTEADEIHPLFSYKHKPGLAKRIDKSGCFFYFFIHVEGIRVSIMGMISNRPNSIAKYSNILANGE